MHVEDKTNYKAKGAKIIITPNSAPESNCVGSVTIALETVLSYTWCYALPW